MTTDSLDFATLILTPKTDCPLTVLAPLLRDGFARRVDDACRIEFRSAQEIVAISTGITATLTLDPADEGSRITLTLFSSTLPRETLLARLAGIAHHLATSLPIVAVVWLDDAVRLPAEKFVAALAPTLDAPSVGTNVTNIAPRRIQARRASGRIRPDAASYALQLQQMLPAVKKHAAPVSANDNAGPGRPDSPTKGHERMLRGAIIHVADKRELADLRDEAGIVPVEARLSTWAVSSTVATVSLPVAAPVMIYNLARGEDMRVASLAMGIAGLFLALDTSGAMASVVAAF